MLRSLGPGRGRPSASLVSAIRFFGQRHSTHGGRKGLGSASSLNLEAYLGRIVCISSLPFFSFLSFSSSRLSRRPKHVLLIAFVGLASAVRPGRSVFNKRVPTPAHHAKNPLNVEQARSVPSLFGAASRSRRPTQLVPTARPSVSFLRHLFGNGMAREAPSFRPTKTS